MAAAGDLPDRKFLREVDAFSLSGPVENLGSIEGRAVSLLGTSVANGGSIVAPRGVIALVAGEKVVLTRLEGGIAVEVEGPPQGAVQGISQSGVVDAARGTARFAVGDHYSLAINHSGVTRARNIEATGGDGGLVRIAGTLDASASRRGATGGSVRVTGDRVQLEGALLDASGAAGGGEIRVGGDLRGEGPLRNARRTLVDSDSVLRADALESGDGGSAVVYGEEAAGFLGSISARGGAAGGDGGFAELSSNGLLIDEGDVDVRAPAGRAGTLLYDPRDIELVGGTDDGDDTPNSSPGDLVQGGGTAGRILFADVGEGGAEPFQIFESELEGTDAEHRARGAQQHHRQPRLQFRPRRERRGRGRRADPAGPRPDPAHAQRSDRRVRLREDAGHRPHGLTARLEPRVPHLGRRRDPIRDGYG